MASEIKVLIVDDDELVRAYLSKMLKIKLKTDYVLAANGIEGLVLLESERPDLVFLDISMPVMSGVEFLQIIRANEAYAELPVVIITALSDKKIIREIVQLGILDYLLKPFEQGDTVPRMDAAIKHVKEKKREQLRQLHTIHPGDEQAKKKILIADKDEIFRSFLKDTFSPTHFVTEKVNGADALSAYIEQKPDIVFFGENLEVIHESMAAQKIRDIAGERPVSLFLCYDDVTPSPVQQQLFNGCVGKTYSAEAFLIDFYRQFLSNPEEALITTELVKQAYVNELTDISRKTFLDMFGLGAKFTSDIPLIPPRGSIYSDYFFSGESGNSQFVLRVFASVITAKKLNKTYRGKVTLTGELEAFRVCVNDIGKKACQALEIRGLPAIYIPKSSTESAISPQSDWIVNLQFETAPGELFYLHIFVDH